MMNAKRLRQHYLDFFSKAYGHAVIGSASLIPEHDPSVLFTTAGMHPLVPFLLGERHPAGTRLVNCQKCLRTGDIEAVGDNTHLTFFEMLGNWSLNGYWKGDSLRMSYEFLTEQLGLEPERLYVTCFAGDEDAPRDLESAEIWASLGIRPERILARRLIRRAVRYGKEIGIRGHFLAGLAETAMATLNDVHSELNTERDHIFAALDEEEGRFGRTLQKGEQAFFKALEAQGEMALAGDTIFHLYDTYGFPPELTEELAQQQGYQVDVTCSPR